MANIERRRKQRKLIIVLASAGAVLVLGGIIALSVFLAGRLGKKEAEPVPTQEAPSASVSETILGEAPEATEAAETPPPDPPEPRYTAVPEEPETTEGAPVRISDEQSSALLVMDCVKSYGAEGSFLEVKGRLALAFVNNTDRSLYSAEFEIGDLEIGLVTLSGVPAKFTAEDGLLSVPFVNELAPSEEVELFITFSCRPEDGASFELPRIGYDTSYLLTAYVYSEAYLGFSGCRAESTQSGSGVMYSVENASVHSVRISVRY